MDRETVQKEFYDAFENKLKECQGDDFHENCLWVVSQSLSPGMDKYAICYGYYFEPLKEMDWANPPDFWVELYSRTPDNKIVSGNQIDVPEKVQLYTWYDDRVEVRRKEPWPSEPENVPVYVLRFKE